MRRRDTKISKSFSVTIGLIILVVGILLVGLWFGNRRFNQNTRRVTGVWVNPTNHEMPMMVWSFQQGVGLVGVTIEGELMVPVSRQYGTYQAKNLYNLAVQENNMNMLLETLGLQLNTVLDYYVVSDSFTCLEADFACYQSWLWKSMQNRTTISDLSWSERLELWWLSRKVNPYDVQILALDSIQWSVPVTSIDGLESREVAESLSSARLANYFEDKRFREESLNIEIVNTTTVSGMAGKMKDIVSGLGGHVVKLSSEQYPLEACLLRVNEDYLNSYSVVRLQELLHCNVSTLESGVSVDVQLLIGAREIEWMQI